MRLVLKQESRKIQLPRNQLAWFLVICMQQAGSSKSLSLTT